jgi:hypothetical protein
VRHGDTLCRHALQTEEFKRDLYVPYNKITAVLQWIQAMHDTLPPDAVVCIIDVDVVLLEVRAGVRLWV